MTKRASIPPQVSTADWKSRIATKAGLGVEAVDEILTRHAIEPQSIMPRRRTITLTGLRLAGRKSGILEDGVEAPEADFSFRWGELGPGLWVVASDRNSKGKSSILNAFKAAIKGKFPGSIKKGVWRWLTELEVGLRLDDIQHRVIATKPAGSEAVGPDSGFEARLERSEHGAWASLISAKDAISFEQAISDFFMQELGFEKFQAYQASTDSKRSHGWPSMGSALFISGSGPALFGDETADGLPIRLLQLFIGLPWISTYSAISTCLKQVDAESARIADVSAKARSGIDAEIAALRRERDGLLEELATLPSRGDIHRRQREDDRRLVAAREKRSAALKLLAELQEDFQGASSGYDSARNLRMQIEDELAAGHVFRRLRPTTCPSCDAVVHAEEHDHGSCPLCGEKEKPESEEMSARIDALRSEETEAKKAKDSLDAEIRRSQALLRGVDSEITELEGRIGRAGAELVEAHKSAEIEGRIAALTGGIEALERALPPESKKVASTDARVLKAAQEVTRDCFDGTQQTILNHFSEKLREIASSVGAKNLKSVHVKANRIDIVQENAELTFSGLNPGERLRFRIAAALAAVETAKWSGAGRHPGLIVLDSPAAEEMSGDDFGAVLASLQTVLADQPDVQVIVGALMRQQIKDAVRCQRMRYARGDDYLF
ncbi:hypothetical protein [Methylosinus sp. RM1]|uniref:hypothetical protein n=1 Tax=Methylosinus sp. RM1 TaxID=2583817 RepID=UPI00140D0176|nr:hypothetical protein [Methylosinus sp. RM1]